MDRLHETLLDLDDQVKAAMVEKDVNEMARLLQVIGDARRDLGLLDKQLQGALYDAMEAKHMLIPDVGPLERQRPGERKRHDSEALLSRLVARATVDPTTGEQVVPEPVRARIEAALTAALPITPSLGWRHTGLDELGVEWKDLYTSEPGPKSVRLL